MKKVSIVIVTHNSAKYIGKCLSAVFSDIGDIDSQIILIDNFSDDSTLEIVSKFTSVELIKNNSNRGFAVACNQGIKKSQSDKILLLNPDLIVHRGAIGKLMEYFASNDEVGVIGGQLVNPDGSRQFSAGHYPTLGNLLFDRLPLVNKKNPVYFQRNEKFYHSIQHPDWLVGCFLMVKKEVFEEVGLLDERYFMYVEDVDFCYRARQAGFKIVYYPEANAVHYDLGKDEKNRYNKAIHQRIGQLIFFEKFYSEKKFNKLKTLLKLEFFLRRKLFAKSDFYTKYQSFLNSY